MAQLGYLYFIKQSFFDLVQDATLPINKPDDQNGKHGRPVFCAIKLDGEDFYWVIPFSHQIEKYQKINDKKIKNMEDAIRLHLDTYLEKRKLFFFKICFQYLK